MVLTDQVGNGEERTFERELSGQGVFPDGSGGKASARNAGDLGSIPGLGRSPGEGKGYPLQYFGLENSMGCIVYGVAKSRTRLSDFHFHSSQYHIVLITVALYGFSSSHVWM